MFWLWRQHLRQLRMSRTDIKDETKETEGDPAIKMRIRRLRMRRARQRMLAAVPKATVVVTNPTHYAVALTYDSKKSNVPRLVAKGVDTLAARIRDTAREHGVPIVANPPLARTLASIASGLTNSTGAVQGRGRTDRICLAPQRTAGGMKRPDLRDDARKVAHDFNNLLTAIIGAADAILERSDDRSGNPRRCRPYPRRRAPRRRRWCGVCAERHHDQAVPPRLISINETIRATSRLLDHSLGADVALTLDLSGAGRPGDDGSVATGSGVVEPDRQRAPRDAGRRNGHAGHFAPRGRRCGTARARYDPSRRVTW